MTIKGELALMRKDVDRNPTEKQIKAGNYKKGHIRINGFGITIENPRGSWRRGVDKNGKKWEVKMANDYGYFTRTIGKDGDQIDCFIGPNPSSKKIFVVDQLNPSREFDESKVMLGFDNIKDAKNGYMSNYSRGWKGFGNITEVDEETFKTWLYDGKRQRKPFGEYKEIKESNINENVMTVDERELMNIITESVRKVLFENDFNADNDFDDDDDFYRDDEEDYGISDDEISNIAGMGDGENGEKAFSQFQDLKTEVDPEQDKHINNALNGKIDRPIQYQNISYTTDLNDEDEYDNQLMDKIEDMGGEINIDENGKVVIIVPETGADTIEAFFDENEINNERIK